MHTTGAIYKFDSHTVIMPHRTADRDKRCDHVYVSPKAEYLFDPSIVGTPSTGSPIVPVEQLPNEVVRHYRLESDFVIVTAVSEFFVGSFPSEPW